MTRANSVEIGGRDSRTTSSMACRNEEPARRALAISVIVSGSCLLNAFRRPFLRRLSQKRGNMKPMSMPTSSASGDCNADRKKPRMNSSTGTPTIDPSQMNRYSDGFRRRSARASSLARFAPKSRPSTTLLRLASA